MLKVKIKNLIISAIIGGLIVIGIFYIPTFQSDLKVNLGAPFLSYQRSLIPIDSTENLGTTTSKWDKLFVNFASTTAISATNLDISGTCTGCPGEGDRKSTRLNS